MSKEVVIQNSNYFHTHIDEIVDNNEGKFVLIANLEVVKYFDTLVEWFNYGVKTFWEWMFALLQCNKKPLKLSRIHIN